MSAFKSDLITRMSPPTEGSGRNVYTLTTDFTYESEILGTITIPVGFKTDFASIPRIAWRYIDPEDRCIAYPSVVHDYLYSLAGKFPPRAEFTREQADQVLREAMVIAGARTDQRAVVYRMVRLFGGSHWNPLP